METNNENTIRVQVGANLDPVVYDAVKGIAEDEDRSVSRTIERLLKTHPRVQPMLETEAAAAG